MIKTVIDAGTILGTSLVHDTPPKMVGNLSVSIITRVNKLGH